MTNKHEEEERIDMNALLTSTLMFFERQETGGMGEWAYLNGGREHLERFFESEDYEANQEIHHIPEIARQAFHILPKEFNLIELGPAKAFESKTKSFLDEFNKLALDEGREEQGMQKYFAIDIVPEYAEDARDEIQKSYHVASKAVIADYTSITEPVSNNSDVNVLISWNPPIWNAARDHTASPLFVYADHLKKLGEIVGKGGYVIITHYPMHNEERMQETYMDENNEKAVLAIPALIQKHLNPTITISEDSENKPKSTKNVKLQDCFNFEASVEEDGVGIVNMSLVSKYDFTVEIGQHFKKSVKAGEHFTPVSSAKPRTDQLNDMAQKAGFKVQQGIPDKNGRIVGQILKYAP